MSDHDDREPHRGDANILIVDDNRADRRLMSLALAECGYRVIEAEGGPQALEIFQRNPQGVDLILTDILMPGMDGVQLIQRVRETSPKMKVVFISGFKEGLARTLEDKDAERLEKSPDLSPLVEKVREALAKESVLGWLKKAVSPPQDAQA